MTGYDDRAVFVLAQYFIEEGRVEEARLLLRQLRDVPVAQEWAERLDRGEQVDTGAYQWEPDAAEPTSTRAAPSSRQREFKPGRLLVSLLMVLVLIAPVVQPFLVNRGAPTAINVRSLTRQRVQMACLYIVREAAQDGRLVRDVGSCMEWSFSLTEAQMDEAISCHRDEADPAAFRRCLQDVQVVPPGIVPLERTF